jgi:copper homeostasis protein
MPKTYTLEICVYSVEGAIAASEGGADRIELCDNLPEGGTTPSAATIELARKYVPIKLHVIIRPRGGDFLYSKTEFDTMTRDIEIAKTLNADGVVLGILLPDGSIDIRRTRSLVDLARPMQVTFHRAFDRTVDPLLALEQVIETGANRILTSGQREIASEGKDLIHKLVNRAGNRISIMPGSGINHINIKDLIRYTGAKEFHMSAKKQLDGAMKYRKKGMAMGGSDAGEYSRWITDIEQVRKVHQILSAEEPNDM